MRLLALALEGADEVGGHAHRDGGGVLARDVREPDRYAHGHHASVLRSHQWRTAENSAGYLLPRLRPQDRLLDVGTGPGTITVDLAERLSDGWVTGIDSA